MKLTFQSFPTKEPLTFEYQFCVTKLGTLLVASWQNSLIYVAFAGNKKAALQEAKDRLLPATWIQHETSVHKQFLRYLKNPQSVTVPFLIALSGTPFQLKVWNALGKIPFGKTIFYSDLAKGVQRPSAVRAVASVVAKNPIAILIPCHRVLPRSGGIGNYHWGSKNKSALLTWEQLQ